MLQENRFTARGLLICSICTLFFLYEFLLRTILGTFQAPLVEMMELSTLQFSLLSTTVFAAIFGIMQIPVGIIVDNIGLKKAMALGCGCCASATLGFGLVHTFPLAVLCRFFMGLGASFGFVCLLVSLYDWLPKRYSAVSLGCTQFIGTLGPMFAAGPLQQLANSRLVEWDTFFQYLGLIGFAILFLILLFVDNNHQQQGKYIILNRPEKASTRFYRIFQRSQPWYIGLCCACLYFALEYLSESEGRTFLMLKGFSLPSAAYLLSLSWVGYAVGCPVLGLWSDYTRRRRHILLASSFFAIGSMGLILTSRHLGVLVIAHFCLGLGASGVNIGFAMVTEQFERHFMAIGFGLQNGIITAIVSLVAPCLGWLLDLTHGHSFFGYSHYHLVFCVLIAMPILSFFLATQIIKETYGKSLVDFTYLTKSCL